MTTFPRRGPTGKRLNILVVLAMLLAMAVPTIAYAGVVEGVDAPLFSSEEVEITGTLEEIGDGYVVVDGQTIVIGTGAEVKGPLTIGDVVEVHARANNAGDLVAREIEPDDGDAFNDNSNANDDDNANGNANDDDNANGNENADDDDNANGNENDHDNANGNDNDDDGDNANGNENDDDNANDDDHDDNANDDDHDSNDNGDDDHDSNDNDDDHDDDNDNDDD